MTDERYNQCMNIQNPDLEQELTEDEIREGWHYCWDWDGLLVGPDMKDEWECCTCFPNKEQRFPKN